MISKFCSILIVTMFVVTNTMAGTWTHKCSDGENNELVIKVIDLSDASVQINGQKCIDATYTESGARCINCFKVTCSSKNSEYELTMSQSKLTIDRDGETVDVVSCKSTYDEGPKGEW